jgi:hypothetical protein
MSHRRSAAPPEPEIPAFWRNLDSSRRDRRIRTRQELQVQEHRTELQIQDARMVGYLNSRLRRRLVQTRQRREAAEI